MVLFHIIPTGLLAATMLDEVAGYEGRDVALDGFGGNAGLSLDPRDFQTRVGLDAVEDCLLTSI